MFAGEFDGQVNGFPRHGVFLAGIDHVLPLPVEEDDFVAITGGVWIIRVPFRTIRGVVLQGILTKNADETFEVDMNLLVTGPSVALTTFTGTLRHDVFPPTIDGTIE